MVDYFVKNSAMAEVGAVSIVGGAIMFKTNVMTTAIMNYTSMGDFTTAMALARVLIKDYDLLILDEPTASMDQASIPAAEKMISEYRERTGCTILLITHSPEQAERLADSVITLEDGKIM